MSDVYLNHKLIPRVVCLSDDPVPNIRFNVAKTLEKLRDRLNPYNKRAGIDALKKLETDNDVDVGRSEERR